MDFNKYNLPIPENIFKTDEKTQNEVYLYFEQMDNNDRIAYKIAYEHLGTSFNILRSNGFKEWKAKNSK
jgi:hypothetical protein